MKVNELIEILKSMESNREVMFFDYGTGRFVVVDVVEEPMEQDFVYLDTTEA